MNSSQAVICLNMFLSIIRYSETQRNMQQSIELFECSKTAYLNILFSFAMTLSQLFYLFHYDF